MLYSLSLCIQVSTEAEYVGFHGGIDIPDLECPSNANFRAHCGLHLLKIGVMQLIEGLNADILPSCAVCKQLEDNSQIETEELASLSIESFVNFTASCVSVVCSSYTYTCNALIKY